MYWFTADEHYGHANIIKNCHRPFSCVEEMNETLIGNHNKVVTPEDIVVHVGDFCWGRKKADADKYFGQLNGQHIMLKGSHDYWMPAKALRVWERQMEKGIWLVAFHWSCRVWARSYYNSWMVHGHSHGTLPENCPDCGYNIAGKQYDVGVDNNNYSPVSWDQVREIISQKEDNAGYKAKLAKDDRMAKLEEMNEEYIKCTEYKWD